MASHFLHESLTRSLLREMASGVFRDGQRFYSLRKIGRQWRVSEPTVTGSLRWLVGRGLLRMSARRGCFLTTGFQQRAQLLLRKARAPELAAAVSLEQKAWLLQGERGGVVALLLESDANAVLTAEEAGSEGGGGGRELPAGLSSTVSRCAGAFARECERGGFEVRYFLYDAEREDGGRRERIRAGLERGGFAGAVVFCRSSHRVIRPLLEPLTRGRLPVVILYDDCQGLPVHSISLNNTGMGYDAVRHFYRMGHRRITVLAPRSSEKHHRDRVRGCVLAASEGGCRGVILSVFKIGGRAGGVPVAVRRHFANRVTRPTAVFVTLSGLLRGAGPLWERLGLEVPGDLSVIVCSSKSRMPGLEGAGSVDTMHLDLGARVGRMAARQLQRLQAGEALEKSVLLDVVHKRRGSVAKLGRKSEGRKSKV
ncbi:hypothetical protein Ga0100230_003155 [Opitutaceae bacterium TAV3]|nr:hypothetical protein Ga0100230_003155 [Opitutaceae bacterium TAV3]